MLELQIIIIFCIFKELQIKCQSQSDLMLFNDI